MAEPEDIDKLLREIDALNNPGAARPAPRAGDPTPPQTQPQAPSGPSGRGAWAGAGAVGGFAVGGVAGLLLPFLGAIEAGIGAALGGAVVAFLSRPPEWFAKR